MQDTQYATHEPIGVPSGYECIIAFWMHRHRVMDGVRGKAELVYAAADMVPYGWTFVAEHRALAPRTFDFQEVAP